MSGLLWQRSYLMKNNVDIIFVSAELKDDGLAKIFICSFMNRLDLWA